MTDLRVTLEAIRENARSRVKTLKEGGTFYNKTEKAFYLQQYEAKIRELDRLIAGLPDAAGKPVPQKTDLGGSLKRYWHKLFE